MYRSLVVGDSAAGREMIGKELVNADFSVLFASDVRETMMLLDSERLDLIVTDHREHGVDGIEILRSVRNVSDVPVIVLAASGTVGDCERAMREGANRYLQFRKDIESLGGVGRDVAVGNFRQGSVADALTTEEVRAEKERRFRRVLQRLVVESNGNIAEVARRMNRDRSTIRYHLRRMGMLDGRTAAAKGPKVLDPPSVSPGRDVFPNQRV